MDRDDHAMSLCACCGALKPGARVVRGERAKPAGGTLSCAPTVVGKARASVRFGVRAAMAPWNAYPLPERRSTR